MEHKITTDKYSIYKCPSCENFFVIDDWSDDNDICIPCLEGMEYTEVPDGTAI